MNRNGVDPSGSERWWLSGEEICQFCLTSFAYEVELRCALCDRPICMLCVMVSRPEQRRVCPECFNSPEEE